MLWQKGDKLQGGKYTIREVLGDGGFGITYRVRDRNGHLYAVKTLNEMAQARPDFNKLQQDFMNEALHLAKFNHPNIVKIYKVFQESVPRNVTNQKNNNFFSRFFPKDAEIPHLDIWCILMEYVEGENLNDYLSRLGVLPEAEAVRYIKQIGEALTVVHNEGLLHRDVKPANIILRASNSEAVLIDFGIAREFTPNHTTHTEIGTPSYGAIEQFYPTIAPPGEYTDVYALAATLYALVTGKLPNPTVTEDLNLTAISYQVQEAIRHGMALQPQDRPQSVQDWLKLLGNNAPNENRQPLKVSLIPRTVSQPSIPLVSYDDLNSELRLDYRKLRDLLIAGKWKEADGETVSAMLKAAKREKEKWLRVEDIENFPCAELCAIDQLWVKHSNGHFGFSVQKRIWQEVGGKIDYEAECRLGDRIGWRVQGQWLDYAEYTFDLKAPIGHLPLFGRWCWWSWSIWDREVTCGGGSYIASRSLACKL